MSEIVKKESISSILEKVEAHVFANFETILSNFGINKYPAKLLLLAFKSEQILEIYAIVNDATILIESYPFTGFSGTIGPKLKNGDKQIPEGIYSVEYLNPNSNYYLSMKINYPNDFDREKACLDGRVDLGGDIFIHGKSKTTGCIPVGDEAMEEIFVLAAKADISKIKVIICPHDFRKNEKYPVIPQINWSEELYDNLKKELGL